MAWNTTLGIMIRNAIGDTVEPPKYTDLTLAPLILTAVQGILFNITTAQTYIIDIENSTLTPDPTDPTINDNSILYLVTLKSSAMLLRSEVRVYGQQAISIRDGTSAIDLKRDLKALTALAEDYETELKKAIDFYIRNRGSGYVRAVVSPYCSLLPNLDLYFYNSRSLR